MGPALLGGVKLILPFGAFMDLGIVTGPLPTAEFGRPDETREQVLSRNEPISTEAVSRGRGIEVEVAVVKLGQEQALLGLARTSSS